MGYLRQREVGEPKSRYFKVHQISKLADYELHHIVPLSYVRNKMEYKLIDNYKNLIYLSKEKHKKITREHIIFRGKKPKIQFVSRLKHSDVISAKNHKNTKFNPSLLLKMNKLQQRTQENLSSIARSVNPFNQSGFSSHKFSSSPLVVIGGRLACWTHALLR